MKVNVSIGGIAATSATRARGLALIKDAITKRAATRVGKRPARTAHDANRNQQTRGK